MKKIFLSILLLISFSIFSQTKKEYSGPFEKGTATYQYCESKNGKKIFCGKFNYKNEICNINGNFKNDKKIGDWIYENKYDSKEESQKYYAKTTGSYLNGLKNGKWVYYTQTFNNNKIIPIITELTFVNDTLVGKYKYDNHILIEGQFSNKGEFIGLWHYRFPDGSEHFGEFKDNVLLKLTKKRVSNGEIMDLYDSKIDIVNFNQKFANDTIIKRVQFSQEFANNKDNFKYVYGLKNGYEESTRKLITFFLPNIVNTIQFSELEKNSFILLNKMKFNVPEILINNLNFENNTRINDSVKISIPNNSEILTKQYEGKIYNFNTIDVNPIFETDNQTFFQYISKNYKAFEDEIDARLNLFVELVIETDGSISNIKVQQRSGYSNNAEREINRILKYCPKWKPGIYKNETVRVKYSFPIMIVNNRN
jgi:hypothetical protein